MNNADTTIPMAQPPISSSTDSQPQETLLQRGAFDPPFRPGTLGCLDRFEILRLLGEGGMGQVYLAREPRTETQVAVKIMRPQVADDPQSVHRFLTEARHMYRLSHPRILRVLEVSDRKEGPYYVMPYVAGGSLLGQYRPGEPMSTERTLSIARQVAEALAHAHAHGLIHRDIKPGNVLLDKEGNAYLTDFGLVRTVFNDSMVDASASHLEGTAPYMSPAVAQGEAEDTRCDIYAFGALLYELLTGQPPYTGRTSQLILDQVLKGPPQPIRAVSPKASPALVKIAEGCMARELRDRYASMADVVADLDRASKGQAPFGSLRQQRRRPVRLAAALLGILLLAGVFSLAPSLLKNRKENVTPPIPPSAPLQKKAALSEKGVGQHVNKSSDPNMTQAERKAVTLTKPYPTSYKGATTDKITVQYAVIELGKQAGLNYNWDESFKNTDPICKEWVYPDIKNMPFGTAMKELLGPVGLTYELRDSTILLKRDSESDTNRTDWGKESGESPTAVWQDAPADAGKPAAKTHGPFTYTVDNGAITITKYNGPGGAVVIPKEISGLPVVAIEGNAFFCNRRLTSILIPDSVENIGFAAFYGCADLTNVMISARHLQIGNQAFSRCSNLSEISLPEGVVDIKTHAFAHCGNLVRVKIPASMTSLGDSPFTGCNKLTSIELASGNPSFCAVDGILFSKDKTSLLVYPGGKQGSYEVPSGVQRIGAWAFGHSPYLSGIIIPSSVARIDDCAFIECSSLEYVEIPATIDVIRKGTFERCRALKKVRCDGNVPIAADSESAVFSDSPAVTVYYRPGTKGWGPTFGGRPTAVWQDAPTDAGKSAVKTNGPFAYTVDNGAVTITTYTGPGGAVIIPKEINGRPVTTIDDSTFTHRGDVTSISIQEGVTRIVGYAFFGCGLTDFVIPKSVTSVDGAAFSYCTKLLSFEVSPANPAYCNTVDGVLLNKDRTCLIRYPGGKAGQYVIPSGVKSIGNSAFCGWSKLTNLVIPEGVTNIGQYAVAHCGNLTRVQLPESLTRLEFAAFKECSSLTQVFIPNNVSSIEAFVFFNCQKLTDIAVDSRNPAYCSVDGVLFDKHRTRLVSYPGGKAGSYTVSEGVTELSPSAFSGCGHLPHVTLPESITRVGAEAFTGCGDLAAVYFNGNAPWADQNVFGNSTNATVYYRPNMKGWGKEFGGRPTAVWADAPVATGKPAAKTDGPFIYTVDNGAVTITKYTGPGGKVVIPKEINGMPVKMIGDRAFIYRGDVTGVSIPDSVTQINGCAFLECTGLTQFDLPDSVTSFTAIRGCHNMVAFVVDTENPVYWSSPDGVLFNKGRTTLISCPGGKTGVYRIPDTVKEISWNAFKECAKLTQVILPNGLTNIGDYAFADCAKLTGITLPASVISARYGLFFRNIELSAIAVDAANPAYSERGGVLFDKTGSCLVSFPAGKAGRYTVPDGVSEIARDAFGGCLNLTSVTLPASVMRIGQDAFSRCGERLTAVYFNGDAPQADTDVFVESKKVTVYYRPVTTGWGLTFGGRPTKEWKP